MGADPNFDVRELEYQYRRNGAGISFAKQFNSVPSKFICAGLNLAVAPDLVPKGKFPILKNIRSYQPGQIDCRPGQLQVNAAALDQLLVHSLKRLNDETNGLFTRIIGAGTKLYAGTTVPGAAKDTGYSGDPLSFVAFRPDQSPESWMYVADRLRMRKIKRDGTNYAMGIAPPNSVVLVTFAAPNVNLIEGFEAVGTCTIGGTAGALTAPTRVATTIQRILFDSGTTGWASVQPVSMDQIELGENINLNSGFGNAETATIFGIYKTIPSTTIGSITYDSGSTGLCTIQPVSLYAAPAAKTPARRVFADDSFDDGAPDPVLKKRRVRVTHAAPQPNNNWLTSLGLVADNVILLAAGTGNEELVRIISVSVGKDGIASVRVTTTLTHVAAETIDGVRSFRSYLTQNHVAAETLGDINLRSTITVGTGYIQNVTAYNLAVIGTRPTQDTDEIHLSIRLDNLASLVEGRILFDIDGTTHDFAHNALFHAFRPNDLVPGIKSSTTMLNARQRALQARYVDDTQQQFQSRGGVNKKYSDDYGDFSLGTRNTNAKQTPTGDSQWFDLHFKVSELTRIGTDKSRGLADVAGIRIQLQTNASVQLDVSSLWIGGSYGPDVGELGDPYLYRMRYRSSTTGAKSNPGPPMRSGISPHRQRVQVTPTASPDAQVDKIDIFRWGGLLPAWLYIGTATNSATPFFDEFGDQDVVFNDLLEFDNFQPFPTLDTPKSGTCNVAGTAVTGLTGDPFNTAWAPGTIININGINQIIYDQPSSTVRLNIVDNAGTLGGVPWFIAGPVLLGQPMPIIFGPVSNFVFGLGDKYQPGVLFYTKGNNPDAAPEVNFLEVTTPSDPLMNGGEVNGRGVVLSTQTAYAIVPSFDQVSEFQTIELGIGRGLFARWFFCIHKGVMYIGGKDGIYASSGGEAVSITGDIYPLFPHDGQPGKPVNGINPPDMTQVNDLRLSGSDNQIYFDFVDTNGDRRTLMYDTEIKGWYYDQYASPALTHYGDEGKGVHGLYMGCADGRYHQSIGKNDNGAAINWQVRTRCEDAGEQRADKQWGDAMVDMNANGSQAGVIITPYYDNFDLPAAAQTTGAEDIERNHYLVDLESGAGKLARNLSLDLICADLVGVTLYAWEPSFVIKPEDTVGRFSDWDDLGYAGAKFIQGVIIEADTQNIVRAVDVQHDGGTVGATIQAQHDGQMEVAYSWPPFVAHSVRLAPSGTEGWKLFKSRFVFEPAPELATNWTTQGTTHDLKGYQHVRNALIALESTSVVTLTVNVDGTDYVYQIASTGGAFQKIYVPFQAVHGKVFKYTLTSDIGFRLYVRDCEVRCRQFGAPGPYLPITPFGDISRIGGARI